MSDEVVSALIARLQPLFYFIGLFVVLGVVSFGGTIINLFWQKKHKEEDKLQTTLKALELSVNQNSLALAKVEAKLDIFIETHNKDINNLGRKVKELSV